MDTLDATAKEALELRYLQDLPFEEMARKLNITPATARKRVSRAIEKLRVHLRRSV
jgi:RNA polymerase sigma factor (sigma-70 family)